MYSPTLLIDKDPLFFLYFFRKWENTFLKYIKGALRLFFIKAFSNLVNNYLRLHTKKVLSEFNKSLDQFNKDPGKDTYYRLRLHLDVINKGLTITDKYRDKRSEFSFIQNIFNTFSRLNNDLYIFKDKMQKAIHDHTYSDINSVFTIVKSDQIWNNRPKCYSFDF